MVQVHVTPRGGECCSLALRATFAWARSAGPGGRPPGTPRCRASPGGTGWDRTLWDASPEPPGAGLRPAGRAGTVPCGTLPRNPPVPGFARRDGLGPYPVGRFPGTPRCRASPGGTGWDRTLWDASPEPPGAGLRPAGRAGTVPCGTLPRNPPVPGFARRDGLGPYPVGRFPGTPRCRASPGGTGWDRNGGTCFPEVLALLMRWPLGVPGFPDALAPAGSGVG